MAVILFYSPFDQRARDAESLMIAFRAQGHQVISLSQASGNGIHAVLQQHGIETVTHVLNGTPGIMYFLRHAWYLIAFCRQRKIDVVYSYLEPANFVAVLARYFIRARVIVVRHHVDLAQLQNFDRSFSYRMTYRMARDIIAVSDHSRKFMMIEEGILASKITHINLGYDFRLYQKPNAEVRRQIRSVAGNGILLLYIGRLTRLKRPEAAVATLSLLRATGVNAHLIILGGGEEEQELVEMVAKLGLQHSVSMPGHVTNVVDYLAAADFLLHPSLSESSCVVVKEAALVRLPVIVCAGVGDFDEYMRHLDNGFVLHRDNYESQASALILKYRDDSAMLDRMKDRLHEDIFRLFDVRSVLKYYDKFNQA